MLPEIWSSSQNADKAPACLIAPKTDRNLREMSLLLFLRGTGAGSALSLETTPLQQSPGRRSLVWSHNLQVQQLSSALGLSAACSISSPLLDIRFSWKRYGLLLKIVVPKGYESTPPKSWGQGKPSSPPLFLSAETSTALSPPPELCNKDVSLLMPKWGLAMGAEGASSFVP